MKVTRSSLLMSLLLAAALIGFALQTYQLVDELFPHDQIFMKYYTVGTLDGFGFFFLMLDMFWTFRNESLKAIVSLMCGACFIGSGICTFVQVLFFDAIRLNPTAPEWALWIVYFVIAIFSLADVYTFAIFYHEEYRKEVTPSSNVTLVSSKKKIV